MDKYFNLYREMISLRGLSDHTLNSYCTYVRSYLDYLRDILHKQPEDVSRQELRFFTLYALHRPLVDTRLPKRRFESCLPFIPSQEESFEFVNTIPGIKQKAMTALMYSSGLRIGKICQLRYEGIDRTRIRIHILHSKKQKRYTILSLYALDSLTEYWFAVGIPMAGFSRN